MLKLNSKLGRENASQKCIFIVKKVILENILNLKHYYYKLFTVSL